MMKAKARNAREAEAGYALLIVMVIGSLGLAALAGALQWTSTTAALTERNIEYFRAAAAAEAATEKVLSHISRDFHREGEAAVYNNLAEYRAFSPLLEESAYWNEFEFSNGAGGSGISVDRLTSWGYTNLNSQYTGLLGMASTYRVIANALNISMDIPVQAAVRQEIQLASIPVFQFAIFYSVDLEINPGPNMNITGRVHSNSALYTQPVSTLTFESHVTSAGEMVMDKSPLDPSHRNVGTVKFEGEHDEKVSSLTLPIGTNNSPEAVRAVLELPPAGEDPNSLMGKQRYFNKADMVVIALDSGTIVRSGSFNNFSTVIPEWQWNDFLSMDESFYNKREGKTVEAIDLDVGDLREWSEDSNPLRSVLGRDISSVYIADLRSQSGSTQSGVRLVNGQTLPSLGLTVATPNPVYIQGHYNAPSAYLGTSNTEFTKPASIAGDSINILSTEWSDSDSTRSLSSRRAGDTTINAAFIGGIVPSNGHDYSGGVENFPRFLENWSGRTLTYNGSMVVMFYSDISTAPWGSSDVYSAPRRDWAFDVNFMDATKLPPGTPMLLTMIRGEWSMIAPGTIE